VSTWPEWLPLRDELAPMSAYGAPQVSADASLNTNENPFSPSPALIKAIADRVSQIGAQLNRYPDREASALRTSLAQYINSQSGTSIDISTCGQLMAVMKSFNRFFSLLVASQPLVLRLPIPCIH